MSKTRKLMIRFFVLVLVVGPLIGYFLNKILNKTTTSQVPDYLYMPSPNWYFAIPVFIMMVALVVIGYLAGRKFATNEDW